MSKLDEILITDFEAPWRTKDGERVVDTMEHTGVDSKAAIKQLMLDLVGPDYPEATFGSENYGRNVEKAELRTKIEAL